MSMGSHSYVFKNITAEIKRINAGLNKLKKQKIQTQAILYEYMVKNNMSSYDGIPLQKVKPSKRAKQKSENQKKHDTLELIRESGINDPEQFYEEMKRLQKIEKLE